MNKSKGNLLLLILVILTLVLGIGAKVIFAWLTDTKETNQNGETSEFEISYSLWFDINNDGLIDENEKVYNFYIGNDADEKNLKVIEVSAGNKDAINYLGNLRLKVDIKTNSEYYLRAKFNSEWFVKKTSFNTGIVRYTTLAISDDYLMPYTLSSDWCYDPSSAYVYYTNKIASSTTLGVVESKPTKTIEYKDTTSLTQETKYFIYLDVEFEFVQANRMYAIWEIDNIPQAS